MECGRCGEQQGAANALGGAGHVAFAQQGAQDHQQVQVQRQELLKRLSDPKSGIEDRVSTMRSDLTGAIHNVDTKVDDLMERVEEIIERVEAVFAPFEDRLPAQARDLAKQAHVQAREARSQIRTMIPSVAV